jgi:hypothetical protein
VRTLAWALVAVGIAGAIIAPIILTSMAAKWGTQADEREPFVQISALDRVGYRLAVANEAELLGWRPTAVVAGAGVAAFGVLLLAVRRPTRRDEQ